MSSDIRQDIEVILKEIIAKYRHFSSNTLYYKTKEKYIDYTSLSTLYDENIPKYYDRFFNTIFDQDLEWELYIDKSVVLKPTRWCRFVFPLFGDAVTQFIPELEITRDTKLYFTEFNDNDPLTRIFSYSRFLLKRFPQRSYFCFKVAFVKDDRRYTKENASIFYNKRGIVAYCTTFTNFIHLFYTSRLEKVGSELRKLHWAAMNKLDNGSCDIERIKNAIHDEIEEASELMKEYGIARVAFPLD